MAANASRVTTSSVEKGARLPLIKFEAISRINGRVHRTVFKSPSVRDVVDWSRRFVLAAGPGSLSVSDAVTGRVVFEA